MDPQKLIGVNIRKHRLAAGLSQEALGAHVNADQGYISRLEAGEVNVTITTLQQVASALSVTLKALVDIQK